MIKNKKLIYGIVVVVILFTVGIWVFELNKFITTPTPSEKTSEIIKTIGSDLCLGYLQRNPDIKTAGIYLCKNLQGDQIYEVFYAAEDVGSGYFDLDGNFIAQCGIFAEDPYPGICKEIVIEESKKYSCDYSRDLKQNLCNEIKKLPEHQSCKNLCGDGRCQEVVCLAIGCPCPETPATCPRDC